MEHSVNSKSTSYCGNVYDASNSNYEDDEYYDYIDNGLSPDYDPSLPLEPLIPFKKYSLSLDPSDGSGADHMYDEKTHDMHCHDAFELFFSTFFDEEFDGEITICSFTSVLKELHIDITEKEIYAMFNYIDQDRSGFIDAVDFANFCTTHSFDSDHSEQKCPDIKRLHNALNSVIVEHPFMMTTSDTAL